MAIFIKQPTREVRRADMVLEVGAVVGKVREKLWDPVSKKLVPRIVYAAMTQATLTEARADVLFHLLGACSREDRAVVSTYKIDVRI